MDYKKIEKVHAGKFLDYYNVTYVDGAGNEKVYEMVSRDHELHSDTQLHDHPTDAVVMIINDPPTSTFCWCANSAANWAR